MIAASEPCDVTRRASSSWPSVLTPEEGFFPPSVEPRRTERVLHVALRTPQETQPSLHAALASLCDPSVVNRGGVIDWQVAEKRGSLVGDLMTAAHELRPTLIFMQLQRATPITREVVQKVRAFCPPECVIVNWDGDQHYHPGDVQRQWFVDLGQACDASLVVNTRHPDAYATLKVKHPGYLQIGVDDRYTPAPPAPGTPDVVLLAGCYPHIPAYERRREVVRQMQELLGDRFGVYGGGWTRSGWPSGRPALKQEQEPPVYAGAKAAISMSICNDLPRYTSDRLFRALASGAVTLVERFPDMEGLGLEHGRNCFTWETPDELKKLVGLVVNEMCIVTLADVGANAVSLAAHHTWHARMGELMAIVEAVRACR